MKCHKLLQDVCHETQGKGDEMATKSMLTILACPIIHQHYTNLCTSYCLGQPGKDLFSLHLLLESQKVQYDVIPVQAIQTESSSIYRRL